MFPQVNVLQRGFAELVTVDDGPIDVVLSQRAFLVLWQLDESFFLDMNTCDLVLDVVSGTDDQ